MIKRYAISRISTGLQSNEKYYLVDYDFKEPHDPRRTQFYRELRTLLGGPVSRHTSTTSVVIVEDLESARKIRDLAIEHGATANLREARSIQ